MKHVRKYLHNVKKVKALVVTTTMEYEMRGDEAPHQDIEHMMFILDSLENVGETLNDMEYVAPSMLATVMEQTQNLAICLQNDLQERTDAGY